MDHPGVCVSRDRILGRHFVSRFLGLNSSLLWLEFLSILFSYFYKMQFMKKLNISCFSGFFYLLIFKTKEEYGFL